MSTATAPPKPSVPAPRGPEPKAQRGRALLLDHLPNIRYLHSSQGVLLIVYQNGDVCFFPVNDQSKTPTSSVKLLTSAQKKLKDANATPEAQKGLSSSRYFAYDVAHVDHELCRVFHFLFSLDSNPDRIRMPRKIALSPDKRLLLVFGVMYKGHSCLVVYQILDTPDYFRVVFYDLSLTFVDVCFSPDSTALAAIPTKHPNLIFLLQLPLDSTAKAAKNSFLNPNATALLETSSLSPQPSKAVSFEPRIVGPLRIMGPAKGAYGQPLKIAHISSSTATSPDVPSHFLTWNDEGYGEFCIWSFSSRPPAATSNQTNFEWNSRLLLGKNIDRAFLESEDSPKNYIIDAQFSPVDPCRLMAVVKRLKYPRAADNGIGMLMLRTDEAVPSSKAPDGTEVPYEGVWYRLKEQDDKPLDERDVLCAKWTKTLLLGNALACACVMRGKGLFELVDFKYGSAFQALYDPFVQSACNIVQVGDYRRFWVHGGTGALGEIVVTPQAPSPHPEWKELFVKEPIDWNMRGLGRCVGYFINDISKDNPPLNVEQLQRTKVAPSKKAPASADHSKPSEGSVEHFYGLHLYRCWYCKRVLLKPLQCAQCQSIAYCSKECQRDHWYLHKAACTEIREKMGTTKK